ncbi:MAG: hypothetical protein DRP95_05345 [Candidatus Latescibacterota bacterium]|nr:MAG: hypothetical protein DRP95_05345 [Candidatus Latescibacterota bacterium]
MKKGSLFFLLGVLACSLPEKPEPPQWDIQMNIPLLDYTYRFSEIPKDSVLMVDSLGVYRVRYSEELAPVGVGGELKLSPPEPVTFSQKIGKIHLDSPGTRSTPPITFDELTGGKFRDMHGKAVPAIPTLEIPAIEKDVEAFGTFFYVEVEEGYADITIENNISGIYLDSLKLVLESTLPEIPFKTEVYFQEIPPGESATRRLYLAGKIPNALRVVLTGFFGSKGKPVVVDVYSSCLVKVYISDLTVTGAGAKIPEQRFSAHGAMDLTLPGLEARVEEARIKEGGLHLFIDSRLPVDSDIEVTIPAIRKGGKPFSDALHFRYDRPQNYIFVDLSGAVLKSPKGGLLDSLWYDLSVRTLDTEEDSRPGDFAEISAEDYIEAKAWADTLKFSYLKGTLVKPQEFELQETCTELPLEDMPEGTTAWVAFRQVFLRLALRGVPVDMQLDVHISARRTEDGVVKREERLDTLLTLYRGDQTVSVDVARLLNIFPTELSFGGKVTVWGDVELSDADTVRGDAHIDAPLSFKVRGGEVKVGEIESVELPEEVRDAFKEDRIHVVSLLGEVINHNPLSGSAYILADVDSTSLIEGGGDTLAAFTLPQPTFEDGEIVQSGIGRISVVLDTTKFYLFRGEEMFTKAVVRMDSTEDFVSIKADDYITIRARLEVKGRVKLE